MLWSGLGPPCPQVGAGRERRACSQPCVASGPGSCRRTRPLTDAGSNVIFVCCSSWPGRPASSLLQMLPDNDVRRLPAVLLVTFFFSAGRFSWSVCNHGEMLACRLVAGALGSLLLQQLLLPSGPGPHFPRSLPLETVSLHCPWAVLLKEEQCLGCRSVLLVVKSPSIALPPSPSVSWPQDAALLSQSIPRWGHSSCQLGSSCPTAARKPAQQGSHRPWQG